MPHRALQSVAYPISEAFFATVAFITTTASHLLLVENEAQAIGAMRWLLLPLIGSMFAVLPAILLNPKPEHRKIKFGRALCAIFLGTFIPKAVSLAHPWLAGLYVDPLVILGCGFCTSFLVYILSLPFVRKLYERADRISEEQLNMLEEKWKAGRGGEVAPRPQTEVSITTKIINPDPKDIPK